MDNRFTVVFITCQLSPSSWNKSPFSSFSLVLNNDSKNSRALAKKTKALFKLKKFVEALETARLWLEVEPEVSVAAAYGHRGRS